MKFCANNLFLPALMVISFAALASDQPEQLPLKSGTGFTSETYFEQPHERQVKIRLSGTEGSSLPGGWLDVKQLRIEMFNEDGKLEAVVQAPQCNYTPIDGLASSAGHIEIETGDGKIHVEGDGFLWRQEDNSLTISNNVYTTIKSGLMKLNGP